MRVKKKINDHGQLRCFAVGNAQVSRVGFVRVLESCVGVKIFSTPRFNDADVFCEFLLNGQ